MIRSPTALALALGLVLAPAPPRPPEGEIYAIAREACVYAYPIVTMDAMMRQMTNVPDASAVPMRAPVNRFAHARAYPSPGARESARFDFDTLASLAWLEVSREPIVLSIPDMGDRYFLFQMHDMWTDVFAALGTRTTLNQAGHFAIVPPGWEGALPSGVIEIEAPTSSVWLVGRTRVHGASDYENVHKAQDAYALTPLGRWGDDDAPHGGASTDPPFDAEAESPKPVGRMDGVTLLTRLATLMARYPPHSNDYPILWRMRRIGIEVGRPFDPAKLDPAARAAIDAAAEDALGDLVRASRKRPGTRARGWFTDVEGLGTYGTSYRRRARVALTGLGASLPEDVVHPVSYTDLGGEPYDGKNRYLLHLEKHELPPVDGFWSVTLYDESGFPVPNPIDRFAIGDGDALELDSDGSLSLYIQNESPGADRESNWLPAPAGRFNLTMRLYSPRWEVLDGRWLPPGVVKVTRGPPKGNR